MTALTADDARAGEGLPAPAPSPTIEIRSEPLTYERHAPRSLFVDLALRASGDIGATERVARHAAEMRVELPKFEAERERRARAATPDGMETRVNPGTTDGQGGYFSPPFWLMNMFATAPRPSRVLSALMPGLPMPRGVSEVKLPRITTGTKTGTPADGGAVPSQDIVDAAASQPVTPVTGMSDAALQLLEQSPAGAHLDYAIFQDLAGDYDARLEQLLINGTGTGKQFTGILNLPTGAGGVSAVSFVNASPTLALLLPVTGQAFAQLGDARGGPPETWLMRSARWAWIASGDVNLATSEPRLLGRPVAMDDSIPATLGGVGGTQDAVIAIRPSDSLLLETGQQVEVFLEPLSGEMMVRLRLHGYASALHRQPTGIATITGTGMVVQSGY